MVAPPLVLHVLPVDAFRGAQAYARQMRERLDGAGAHHRTLTIFGSEPGALAPDTALRVPIGPLRRAGVDPRAVWRLRRELRRSRPGLVVAHGGEPLKYCALAGVPASRLVYYKIGLGDDRLAGVRRWIHRIALRRARLVAVVSHDAGEEARAHGVPADRIRYVPNGRDPDAYAPRSRGPENPLPALVWIGQFDVTKRPELFVEVVRALRAEGVALTAAMAGAGPRLEELRPAARDAGVELLGSVADVPELLARSDLLVFTGRPPEGMPGVLIEAGMAALPVVTTRVPGAGDVVDDGTTGVIVPVDDPAALLGATRALVADEARREAMGRAARARCARELSLDASVRRWRAVCEELVPEACASST